LSRIDALLLLMTLIWGANYAIVKSAFSEIDPQAFNAVRMLSATVLFLIVMAVARRSEGRASATGVFYTPAPFTKRDWWTLAWLGLVGHFLYQVLFIGGLSRTSVANSSPPSSLSDRRWCATSEPARCTGPARRSPWPGSMWSWGAARRSGPADSPAM
jgi:drug/metabolite transporter (DMT)-like permease